MQEIKGISEKADIVHETTQSVFKDAHESLSHEDNVPDEKQDQSQEKEDKGKGRAYDSEDDVIEQDNTARLGPDEIFIADSEG